MTDEQNQQQNNKLADLLKKVVSTGVSAAFLTEDTVKGIINDLPLPKEFLSGLLENARNTRNEFITSVKKELKDYLQGINLTKEIERVIENYDFEVNARVSLKRKEKTDQKEDEVVVRKTVKKKTAKKS
jgi:hypothetical protein